MGNCTSNKKRSSFFDDQKIEEEKNRIRMEKHKRPNKHERPNEANDVRQTSKVDKQPPMLSYDEESTRIMRDQIRNNPESFILNNLMLSVQFFENFERVSYDLKNNSITQSDVKLNEDMAQHQKHVLLPDKLLEHLNENVQFQNVYEDIQSTKANAPRKAIVVGKSKSKIPEPLQSQRMFIIHDNIEVNEPEEVSDYSTLIGAPFYKMIRVGSDEPGYVKLRKLETIENMMRDERKQTGSDGMDTDQSSESEMDSSPSDSNNTPTRNGNNSSEGQNFMDNLKETLNQPPKSMYKIPDVVKHQSVAAAANTESSGYVTERRPSGMMKQQNLATAKGQLQHVDKKPRRVKPKTPEAIYIPQGSDSSGYASRAESLASESDYGYATITTETTPKPLEYSRNARNSDSTSIIPTLCISTVKVKRIINGSSEEDEMNNPYYMKNGNSPHDLYREIHYLNSSRFMSHFNDIFLLRLSQFLGFSPDTVKNATTQGASVYCNSYNKEFIKSTEIMPAVNSVWPTDASEWLRRPRNVITNPKTDFKYQWPTKAMIEKSRGSGCVIIPLGYRPTRKVNPEKDLQWKLAFPAAERYLETCMAHSQIRCFMFSVTLFRTFMEIESSRVGLDYTHLKNHLFRQLEENFARWPEDRLGEALMLFLNSLYEHLTKGVLPDFFIPQCNLLKGIPKSVLLLQQRGLADIRESPVMHLLASLKNLKYVKKEYYPVLNYKKLYNILTTNDILRLANPTMPLAVNTEEEKNDFIIKGFWAEQRGEGNANPEYDWKRHQLQLIRAKKAQENMAKRTKPKFHIDRKKKMGEFDMNRRRLVLQLFIPHFISMAEWSEKFRTPRQALIYLEHAKKLTTLLREEPGGQITAEEHRKKIECEIKRISSNAVMTGPPRVPRRNESFTNLPSPSGMNKIKTEQYTSYPHGNDNENQFSYRHPPESPTIKINGLITVDVHTESERPRSQRVVSLQNLDEEADESADFEESRL